MDLANALRELSRHKAMAAVAIALACLGAMATQYKLSFFPPGAEGKSLEFGAAQAQLLVNSAKTPVVNLNREFDPLVARADVFAQLMTSTPVKNAIGRAAGVPGSAIIATAPVEAEQPKALKEPGAEQRANEIRGETVPMRLFFASQPEQPIITVSSQAPTGDGAVKLANAAVIGFQRYITDIQERQNVPPYQRVLVERLGPATGGVVNEGANKVAAGLAFFALLIGGFIMILFVANVRRGMHEPRAAATDVTDWDGGLHAADILPGDRLNGVDELAPRLSRRERKDSSGIAV